MDQAGRTCDGVRAVINAKERIECARFAAREGVGGARATSESTCGSRGTQHESGNASDLADARKAWS
jgi:hypothetical protein